MKLSIIIVNWNGADVLKEALRTVYLETHGFDFEVILVDNLSTDGSVGMVKQDFPQVRLVENVENLGFGRANNQGLALATGEYLMFLNPDVIILDQALNRLVVYLDEHPDVAMVGPRLLNADRTFQHACRRSFPNPFNSLLYVTGLSKLGWGSQGGYKRENDKPEISGSVEVLSGAAMLFRREVYQKIGGFDEQFFMYGEDIDFCKRVYDAGFKTTYVANAQIIHLGGTSSRKRRTQSLINFYQAMWLYYRKHFYRSNSRFFSALVYVGIYGRLGLALVINFFKH
jgi:GT2 family glycosyltransferase